MKKTSVIYSLQFIAIWLITIQGINYFGGYTKRTLICDYYIGIPYSSSWIIKVLLPVTVILMILFFLYSVLYLAQVRLRWRIRMGKKEREIHLSLRRKGKLNRKRTVCITIGLWAVAVIVLISTAIPKIRRTHTEWNGDLIVTHAGGEIDGNTYTNSKEAILKYYDLGVRTFEMDFELTSDGKVVCVHDWDLTFSTGHEAGVMETEEAFLNMPILGKYTPLSFGDLLKLMDEYPDMWIMTDSKYTEKDEINREFESMIQTAKELKLENVLDRLIIQIYNYEMYDTVRKVYPFESWNFTLYQIWSGDKDEFRDYAQFCYENDIRSITMWRNPGRREVFEIAHEYGLDVYVHTVDEPEVANQFLIEGADGIYTNSLIKKDSKGEN